MKQLIVTESHYIANTDEPLFKRSLEEIINETCTARENQTAFIFYPSQEKITFGNLKIQIEKAESFLLNLGLEKGDKIAIIDDKTSQFISSALAAMKIGLIFIGVNPMLNSEKLFELLGQLECQAVICSKTTYLKLIESYPELELGNGNNDKLPKLSYIIVSSNSSLSVMKSSENSISTLQDVQQTVQPTDICIIHSTSGSSGQSKFIPCTYKQMLNNAYFYGKREAHFCQEHIVCICAPIWRAGTFIPSVIVSLIFGTTSVFAPMSPKVDVGLILNIIEQEKCTAIKAIPKLIFALTKHPEFSTKRISSLKTVITGGDSDKMSQVMIRNIIRDLQIKDLLLLAMMSEANVVLMMSSPSDPYSQSTFILPHHEIKIVNFKEEIVPVGTIGEIYLKGVTVISSYWQNESFNNRFFTSHGWLKTKDVGIMQENGSINLLGRLDDFIFTENEVFTLQSLSEHLKNHENIEEIKIIKVPNKNIHDSVLAAFIVTKNGTEIKTEVLRERWDIKKIEFFPKYFIFMDSIPRIYSDKIDRQKLREIAMEHMAKTNH